MTRDASRAEKFGDAVEVGVADLSVIAKNMASGVLLGRFGTGEEAARAVTFLASPAASYITGSEIAIDGGMAAA